MDKIREIHKQIEQSARNIEMYDRQIAQLKAENAIGAPHRPLGLFGSLVVMACTLFVMSAFIVLVAAIFL